MVVSPLLSCSLAVSCLAKSCCLAFLRSPGWPWTHSMERLELLLILLLLLGGLVFTVVCCDAQPSWQLSSVTLIAWLRTLRRALQSRTCTGCGCSCACGHPPVQQRPFLLCKIAPGLYLQELPGPHSPAPESFMQEQPAVVNDSVFCSATIWSIN